VPGAEMDVSGVKQSKHRLRLALRGRSLPERRDVGSPTASDPMGPRV